MSMFYHRRRVAAADNQAAAETVPETETKEAVEKIAEDVVADTVKYTKTDIIKMSAADVRKLAADLGIETAGVKVAVLKSLIYEKIRL